MALDNQNRLQLLILRSALIWLVLANILGVVLATFLMRPDWQVSAITYGRLLPLHMDWQLYGWCSLPLIGLLFKVYGCDLSDPRPRLAIWAWSAALALGGASWLVGQASGKLFLDWQGFARWALLGSMVILWWSLAHTTVTQIHPDRRIQTLRVIGLFVMAGVPLVMTLATRTDVYPAINPQSGGATGTSLLGSTLGVVALVLWLPHWLGIPLRDEQSPPGWRAWLILALHLVLFSALPHGHVSNHNLTQILGLGSLVLWLPLSIHYWRRFQWPAVQKPWLVALAVWACLLFFDGWLAFLPGLLATWKFTHAMVGHAHLAMAGMVSALLVVVLIGLHPRGEYIFANRTTQRLWHGGTVVHVVALTLLGSMEGLSPGLLFSGSIWVTGLWLVRWLAGLAMTIAAIKWLLGALVPQTVQQLAVKASRTGQPVWTAGVRSCI